MLEGIGEVGALDRDAVLVFPQSGWVSAEMRWGAPGVGEGNVFIFQAGVGTYEVGGGGGGGADIDEAGWWAGVFYRRKAPAVVVVGVASFEPVAEDGEVGGAGCFGYTRNAGLDDVGVRVGEVCEISAGVVTRCEQGSLPGVQQMERTGRRPSLSCSMDSLRSKRAVAIRFLSRWWQASQRILQKSQALRLVSSSDRVSMMWKNGWHKSIA